MAYGDENRQQMLERVATSPRTRWGWGPSDLASQEEKEAYQFLEMQPKIAAGQATVADLPEAYGGRPTGTSRRAIRMQQAWEAQQKYLSDLEEQNRQREQAAREERRLSIAEQAEQRQQWAQDTKEQRDAAILEQSGKIQSAIIGATTPDGIKLRPININDDDAPERLQSVIYANRLGMEDQATKEVVTGLLDDAMRVRQQKLETEAATKDAIAKEKVALAKDLGVYGMSIADFTKDGVVDFEAANAAIGKAWAEGKEISPEQAETEEQRKAIYSKITDAEKKLLEIKAREAAFQRRFEARKTSENRTELEAAQIERGIFEDEINRLNRMLGGEPQKQAQTEAAPELSPRDQSALDWANANPDDPRSQRIKQRLGVE